MSRYVSAEVMTHDDFGVPFTMEEGEIVYDARTKKGSWATMTEESWKKHGMGQLGLGMGQKYQRQADGTLPKIA